MNTREHCTIKSATYQKHEHYQCLTLDLGCDFGGSFQGFSSVVLDEEVTGPQLVKEVCALFGVKTIEGLVGRTCFILRSWPTWNEPIEGFEVDGKRWTQNDFVRRMWPDKWEDRFESKAASIRRDIERHAERIQEDTRRLARLREGYVDWSSHPISPATEKGNG
jgi:hypothetical protein